MKANELMIGDWVHIEAHRGFNAQNVKVETIPDNDGDNKYGHHYGHIGTWLDGGDNDFRDVEVKHLQPIPLTPEILEKNGFEKVYGKYKLPNYRIKWKSYTNLFFTVFTGVDGYWNHVGLGVIIGGAPATLDYVHQLQHALRLCEIEKEIIL